MNAAIDKVRPYAKFVAAILGVLLTAGAEVAAVIPDQARPYIQLVLLVATAVSVYGVPNTAKSVDSDEQGA